MKKIIAILAAAAMLLSVAACSNSKEKEDEVTSGVTVQASSVSCREVYDEVSSVAKFPEMVSVQAKSLSNRYGIEQNMYTDCVFMTAQEATLCDTFVLINTNSEQSKDAVIEKLEAFIKQSIETNVDYNPDQYEIIKNASVKTSGSFVYLVFSSDSELIEEMIKENIK